jgi:hypothetical protein
MNCYYCQRPLPPFPQECSCDDVQSLIAEEKAEELGCLDLEDQFDNLFNGDDLVY